MNSNEQQIKLLDSAIRKLSDLLPLQTRPYFSNRLKGMIGELENMKNRVNTDIRLEGKE